MSHLKPFTKDLYQLRFSPMCKPAGEVSNLTQLESHTTRARTMMLWRIVEGIIQWDTRSVELIYQSTLDSISEAFDVFHYPISRYMLAARADIWEAGLAPDSVKQAVAASQSSVAPAPKGPAESLLLAGELAQLGDDSLLGAMESALRQSKLSPTPWVTATGALAYTLGAKEVAQKQAAQVVEGIKASGASTVVADGPETAWALTKLYPKLDLPLPENVTVKLLSVVLDESDAALSGGPNPGTVFIHDSRPACLIADQMATNLAVMPGYKEDEDAFGQGVVYSAPRRVVDALGGQRVFSAWTRSLAKTSGADDGLWLTYPTLAAGLANQRLDYAVQLKADMLVTDSPLAVGFLRRHGGDRNLKVCLLAELLL